MPKGYVRVERGVYRKRTVAEREENRLKGLNNVYRRIANVINASQEGSEFAMAEIAADILTHSIRTYVPVDTGELAGSGYIRRGKKFNGRRVQVQFGFSAGHAAHVHQTDQNYRVGEYLYLEKAISDKAPSIPARYRKALALNINKHVIGRIGTK